MKKIKNKVFGFLLAFVVMLAVGIVGVVTVKTSQTAYAASVSDLIFISQNDDTYSVKARNVSIEGDVVIPATYNGKPVTTVEKAGFKNCDKITSITIPESIVKFKEDAFYGSQGITAVYYLGDLSKWCTIDFFNSTSSDHSNPLSPGTWQNHSGVKLYIKNELIKDLIIPDEIESISTFAFMGIAVDSITISDSVKMIGHRAFEISYNVYENGLNKVYYTGTSAQWDAIQTDHFTSDKEFFWWDISVERLGD